MKQCCKDYLNEQFGGYEDVVKEIYAEYVASTHAKLTEAVAALAADDWLALDRIAHALKGNSLAAGDQELADTAIALRSSSKLENRSEASMLIDKMKTLVEML